MKEKDNKNENEKYSVELTEEEVAIVKAGLQYYLLDDAYGLSLWRTIPEASYSRSDLFYRFKASELYRKLDKVTKVGPDYGNWGNIKQLARLCREDYKTAKKRGEERERILLEENLLVGILEEYFSKSGQNGREIALKAMGEFNQKKSNIEAGKKVKKQKGSLKQSSESF